VRIDANNQKRNSPVPALLTARDREINRLHRLIDQERRWAYYEASNERARDFHLAQAAQFEAELSELIERENQ
jgi:hypothetical protein